MHAGGQEFDPPRLHQWRVFKPSPVSRSPLFLGPPPREPTSKGKQSCCLWMLACKSHALRVARPRFLRAHQVLYTTRSMKPASLHLWRDATQEQRKQEQVRLARWCESAAALWRGESPATGNRRRSFAMDPSARPARAGLYGQANKRIRWMPWQLKAMKDVAACDKPRGVGNRL